MLVPVLVSALALGVVLSAEMDFDSSTLTFAPASSAFSPRETASALWNAIQSEVTRVSADVVSTKKQ